MRRVSVLLTKLVVRLTEIALILVGLGFILIAEDDELVYLAIWDLLAICYVGVGVDRAAAHQETAGQADGPTTQGRPVPVQLRVRHRRPA